MNSSLFYIHLLYVTLMNRCIVFRSANVLSGGIDVLWIPYRCFAIHLSHGKKTYLQGRKDRQENLGILILSSFFFFLMSTINLPVYADCVCVCTHYIQGIILLGNHYLFLWKLIYRHSLRVIGGPLQQCGGRYHVSWNSTQTGELKQAVIPRNQTFLPTPVGRDQEQS